MNPDRISMPDIDVDFDDVKRKDVIEYVGNKYGKDRVAGADVAVGVCPGCEGGGVYLQHRGPFISDIALCLSCRGGLDDAGAEAGVPGYELGTWFGLVAPSKTPEPVIERLSKAVTDAAAHPEFRRVLSSQGIEPLGTSPAAMAARMKSDVEKWAKVIRDSGAKAE